MRGKARSNSQPQAVEQVPRNSQIKHARTRSDEAELALLHWGDGAQLGEDHAGHSAPQGRARSALDVAPGYMAATAAHAGDSSFMSSRHAHIVSLPYTSHAESAATPPAVAQRRPSPPAVVQRWPSPPGAAPVQLLLTGAGVGRALAVNQDMNSGRSTVSPDFAVSSASTSPVQTERPHSDARGTPAASAACPATAAASPPRPIAATSSAAPAVPLAALPRPLPARGNTSVRASTDMLRQWLSSVTVQRRMAACLLLWHCLVSRGSRLRARALGHWRCAAALAGREAAWRAQQQQRAAEESRHSAHLRTLLHRVSASSHAAAGTHAAFVELQSQHRVLQHEAEDLRRQLLAARVEAAASRAQRRRERDALAARAAEVDELMGVLRLQMEASRQELFALQEAGESPAQARVSPQRRAPPSGARARHAPRVTSPSRQRRAQRSPGRKAARASGDVTHGHTRAAATEAAMARSQRRGRPAASSASGETRGQFVQAALRALRAFEAPLLRVFATCTCKQRDTTVAAAAMTASAVPAVAAADSSWNRVPLPATPCLDLAHWLALCRAHNITPQLLPRPALVRAFRRNCADYGDAHSGEVASLLLQARFLPCMADVVAEWAAVRGSEDDGRRLALLLLFRMDETGKVFPGIRQAVTRAMQGGEAREDDRSAGGRRSRMRATDAEPDQSRPASVAVPAALPSPAPAASSASGSEPSERDERTGGGQSESDGSAGRWSDRSAREHSRSASRGASSEAGSLGDLLFQLAQRQRARLAASELRPAGL